MSARQMNATRQMHKRMFVVMTSALLLFACSRDSHDSSASDRVDVDLDIALAGISRDKIQSHLNFLAADEREGRKTGSDGYDESAQYVAEQFAAIGLEPGGTDRWMQPVPFITRMLDVENSAVILHQSTGGVTLEWANDVIIYADKLREENHIRAEVVFAGFGVHAPELGHSDFDAIDVSGKIVATFRRAPATFPSTERAHFSSGRTKAAELVKRGAIGQITLMSRLLERLDPWENWTKNLGTGAPVDGDGIYNGFYDNAFGVAMTIEIARALASLPVPPRRSILFVAVTGEEENLDGSDYFAHYPTVPSSALVANVNIDMPLMLFPLDTVVGYGAEHSSLEGLTAAEAEKEGFELTPDPYPEQVYFIRSDQYSFVRQGIPAVYFAEGVGSSDPAVDGIAVQDVFYSGHYHQPSDDFSQPVDWETALRFSRAGARVGYRIAMDDHRPTWNEADFFGEMFGH